MKDQEKRELINAVTKSADDFAGTQQFALNNAAVDLLKHWDGPALADVHPYAYYVNRLRLAVEKALRARA